MQRRAALKLLGFGTGVGVVATLINCDAGAGPSSPDPSEPDAAPTGDPPNDATPSTMADACMERYVQMHDTNAQALYLDGSLGPLTGNIKVQYVLAGAAITLDFWHGHGGQQHRFTLTPAHFEQLKQGQRVTLGTTTVDSHAHMLFIDPVDEDYRVPGAPDVPVPLGCA
jgi:hypothetical protein